MNQIIIILIVLSLLLLLYGFFEPLPKFKNDRIYNYNPNQELQIEKDLYLKRAKKKQIRIIVIFSIVLFIITPLPFIFEWHKVQSMKHVLPKDHYDERIKDSFGLLIYVYCGIVFSLLMCLHHKKVYNSEKQIILQMSKEDFNKMINLKGKETFFPIIISGNYLYKTTSRRTYEINIKEIEEIKIEKKLFIGNIGNYTIWIKTDKYYHFTIEQKTVVEFLQTEITRINPECVKSINV